MSETYVKRYDVGNIRLDTPYAHFIYELPLLTFGDIQHTIGLSLVFNSRLAGSNPFSMANGYKLNLQKRLIMSSSGVPTGYEDGGGSLCALISMGDGKYTFDDDSQRILRKTGNTFVLEYPDYSKEMYDNLGRIYSVYDKYGENYLTYTYIGGTLSSVTYRGSKVITFTYSIIGSSRVLTSIKYIYNNTEVCSTSIAYNGSAHTMINHYSGVKYYTGFAGGVFTAYSTNAGETVASYRYKITCTAGNNSYTVLKEEENKIIDRNVYSYTCANETNLLRTLDVTDFYGVTNRIQFQDKKPIYSFEPDGDTASSAEQQYPGRVTYYGCDNLVNFSGLGITRVMSPETGLSMDRICNGGFNHYEANVLIPNDCDGLFMISGWVMRHQSSDTNVQIRIEEAFTDLNSTSNRVQGLDLLDLPVDKWIYFSLLLVCQVEEDSAYTIKAGTHLTGDELSIRDFRLSQFTTEISDEQGNTHSAIKEDVVILQNSTNGLTVFPLYETSFINCGDLEANDRVWLQDILKYKINQKKQTNTSEFYVNRGKKITTASAQSAISIQRNGVSYSLSGCYFGTRVYQMGKEIITRIRDDISSSEGMIAVDLLDSSGELYSTNVYDSYMDVISETDHETATTINYERNSCGLVCETTVSNTSQLIEITQEAHYDNNCTKLEKTIDEFNKETTYETDDIWGVVTKVTASDGIQINDTYDGDAFALTSRSFFNSGSYREHSFGYSGGKLSSINTETLEYNLDYNRDELTSVSKNGHPMRQIDISDDKTTWSYYYPGHTNYDYAIARSYDKYNRLIGVTNELQNTYDASPKHACLENDPNSSNMSEIEKYTLSSHNDGNSKLAQSRDLVTGKLTKYAYHLDRLARVGVFDSNNVLTDQTILEYDEIGRHTKSKLTSNSLSKDYIIIKDYATACDSPLADERIEYFSTAYTNDTDNYSFDFSVYNEYDKLKRASLKKVFMPNEDNVEKTYTYDLSRLTKVNDRVRGNQNYSNEYTYDNAGRITQDTYTSPALNYENQYIYDYLGQLSRENNEALDKTFVYNYNSIGNITSVKTYAYTTAATPTGTPSTKNYSYDTSIPDRLISYGYKTITYDSMGCPITYGDKAFEWTRGKLTRLYDVVDENSSDSSEDVRFTYDGYGRRISKSYTYDPGDDSSGDYLTSSNTTYTYDNSGRLIKELCVEEYNESASITREFIYFYDETGIIGCYYSINGTTAQPYYYHKNSQGDVIAILDKDLLRVAEYAYDAFGNCTITYSGNYGLTQNNPIRYRSYYYDIETNLYYLNARYYNPEWRRFISPDSTDYIDPESVNGLNLYAYCCNDPVNYADPSGHFVLTATMIWTAIGMGAAIGAGIGLGVTVVKDLDNGQLFDGDVTFLSYLGNTFGGGIAGAGIGFCSVLGAGLGVGLSTGTALTIGGTTISGATALSIGIGGAFVTGGLGYAIRAGISDQEVFEWSDMFVEAGTNLISGMLTFTGAMAGGIMGVKTPGAKFSLKNFALYHLGVAHFGVYPVKIVFSRIKQKLKEKY